MWSSRDRRINEQSTLQAGSLSFQKVIADLQAENRELKAEILQLKSKVSDKQKGQIVI